VAAAVVVAAVVVVVAVTVVVAIVCGGSSGGEHLDDGESHSTHPSHDRQTIPHAKQTDRASTLAWVCEKVKGGRGAAWQATEEALNFWPTYSGGRWRSRLHT
jgi:hypothetical protein